MRVRLRERRQFTRRALFLAFIAVVALFIASTVVSQISARAIDQDASAIGANAAPSIQHVAGARSELRHLDEELDNYLDDLEQGASPDLLEQDAESTQASWRKVKSEYAEYFKLPIFANESAYSSEIERGLPPLEGALQRTFAEVDDGNIAAARNTELKLVRPRINFLLSRSLELIDFSSAHARALAIGVERTRERSALIAFGLDAVSGVLAVILAILAVQEVRRNTEVLEERNRLMAARAEELEQFSGRVAHDVLSPLMAVSLSLEMAQRTAPDDEKLAGILSRGRSGLKRVRGIVDALLEFARAGAQPEPDARADLDEVLRELVTELQPVAEASNIQLRAEGDTHVLIACTPGILGSVLSNLIRNAIKYMGEAEVRRITVRSRAEEARVRLEVEDTGPGLPPGFERSAFEPYVRARGSTQPGIGLGLATVKRIAQAHGGTVGVHSQPGQGALFWVELPQYREPPPEAPPAA